MPQHKKKNQSLIKIKSVVPRKNAKNSEICETWQLAAESHSMNKNQSLMMTSSSEKCKKWENFETLLLAAECHSINKNQSLIKMKPVVPQKNAKNWENLEICNWLQNAKAWTKINVWWRPVVLQKNAKKWRKFGNIASGCRVPHHKQNWKIYQDQTSSS